MQNNKVRYIEFPTINDHRGNLSFIEGNEHIPFEIKRVFFVYDIPHGALRGSHAHRNLQQLIIVLSGSFDVICDDGHQVTQYHMSKPNTGLYLPPMTWGRQENFSTGCSYAVLTSDIYKKSDYIRDYKEFKNEL